MFTRQRIIGVVLIVLGGFGAICYVSISLIPIWFPDSPFHTPLFDRLWSSKRSKDEQSTSGAPAGDAESRPPGDIENQHPGGLAPITAFHRLWMSVDELFTMFVGLPLRLYKLSLSFVYAAREILRLPSRLHENLSSLRTCQSDDVLTAEATLWLLETSTDPSVHADALQILSQIHWPRNMMKEIPQIPVTMLDALLSAIAGCFQSDGPDGNLQIQVVSSNQTDRLYALCAPFLFLYWEKYVLNVKEVADWTRTSERAFVEAHKGLMDCIRDVGFSDSGRDGTQHGADMLRLLFLTLRSHFDELFTGGPISPCQLSTSTPMGTIGLRVPVYLSEVSLKEE